MAATLHFFKMSGSGNDFVLVDNFESRYGFEFFRELAVKVCNRNNGVGADGLIVFNREEGVDFRWDFFNSDGSVPEMCGNGARCAARLFSILYGKREMRFLTLAGTIDAAVNGEMAKVRMPEPHGFVPDMEIYADGQLVQGGFINTGVPHFVVVLDDVSTVPVKELGRMLRFHERFSPAGTNVNFVSHDGGSRITVRTYERGVEDETLACGTGACAAALVCGYRGLVGSPANVTTSGGEKLNVYYSRREEGFTGVYFEGRVKLICEGDIFLDEI